MNFFDLISEFLPPDDFFVVDLYEQINDYEDIIRREEDLLKIESFRLNALEFQGYATNLDQRRKIVHDVIVSDIMHILKNLRRNGIAIPKDLDFGIADDRSSILSRILSDFHSYNKGEEK